MRTRARRLIAALVLASLLTFAWAGSALAYNGYMIVGANGCDQGQWCALSFYILGGSDYYDCVKVDLYNVNGNYQTTGQFCRSAGWQQVVFYNPVQGNYWVLYYYDSPQNVSSGPVY
jgi:hypothetical protein